MCFYINRQNRQQQCLRFAGGGILLAFLLISVAQATHQVDTNAEGVQAHLDREMNTRHEADTALGGRIDEEAKTRRRADNALGGRIVKAARIRRTAETALGGRIDSLNDKVNELEADLSAGIALSLAMQAPSVSQGKKLNLSIGAGTYNSETAVAFSFGARVNERWSVNGGVGFGAGRGDFGARIGASLEL